MYKLSKLQQRLSTTAYSHHQQYGYTNGTLTKTRPCRHAVLDKPFCPEILNPIASPKIPIYATESNGIKFDRWYDIRVE